MSSQPSDTTRTTLSVLKRWVRRGKLIGRLANGVIRLSLWRQRRLTSRYDRWIARHDTLSADDIKDVRDRIARLPARPSISVIVPTADTAGTDLSATVASVRAQLWPDWDLYLCGTAPSDTSDQRIHCVAPDAALASARGTWIIVLHPGDRLAPAALSEFGLAAIANPAAAIIYADEDRIDSRGRRFDPYFKSDFDPDLLRAQNLAGRACVFVPISMTDQCTNWPFAVPAARRCRIFRVCCITAATAMSASILTPCIGPCPIRYRWSPSSCRRGTKPTCCGCVSTAC